MVSPLPLSRITVPVVTDLQPRTPTEAIISNIAASQAENRAGSPLARANGRPELGRPRLHVSGERAPYPRGYGAFGCFFFTH